MRAIEVHEITGKEVLAADVYDSLGRTLLNRGIHLKETYMNRLLDLGIDLIYVEDDISEGIIPEEMTFVSTKQEAKRLIRDEAERLISKNDVSIAHVYKIVDLIVNDILGNHKSHILAVKDIRLKDENLFAHSLNVSIFAALICKKMDYTYDKICNTVTGCLLHDVGKLFLPKEINEKNYGKRTQAEREEYEKHPKVGYEMLLDNVEINPTSRVTILMHHERVDGSGFPEGRIGNKIHISARICSVCNVFDNMVNGYARNNLLNVSDAVEHLHSMSNIYYDEDIVHKFLKHIPIYPTGSMVLLNNGYLGIVAKNNLRNVLRPVVRVFFDFRNKVKVKYEEFDLMKQASLKIERQIRGNVSQMIQSKL
jgi:HD-GYP domain-containing protein (c-di-GMP phosphodiesterase class II)